MRISIITYSSYFYCGSHEAHDIFDGSRVMIVTRVTLVIKVMIVTIDMPVMFVAVVKIVKPFAVVT